VVACAAAWVRVSWAGSVRLSPWGGPGSRHSWVSGGGSSSSSSSSARALLTTYMMIRVDLVGCRQVRAVHRAWGCCRPVQGMDSLVETTGTLHLQTPCQALHSVPLYQCIAYAGKGSLHATATCLSMCKCLPRFCCWCVALQAPRL
jgi:hypothetical protein